MGERLFSEDAGAISESTNPRNRFRIDVEAPVLRCEFDYPGNVRSHRNLVYELTSYVENGESIWVELVRLTLERLSLE